MTVLKHVAHVWEVMKCKVFSAAELGILVEEKTLMELQAWIHPTRSITRIISLTSAQQKH